MGQITNIFVTALMKKNKTHNHFSTKWWEELTRFLPFRGENEISSLFVFSSTVFLLDRTQPWLICAALLQMMPLSRSRLNQISRGVYRVASFLIGLRTKCFVFRMGGKCGQHWPICLNCLRTNVPQLTGPFSGLWSVKSRFRKLCSSPLPSSPPICHRGLLSQV